MDTKLKSYRYNIFIKITAIILILSSSAMLINLIKGASKFVYNDIFDNFYQDVFIAKEYSQTMRHRDEVMDASYKIMNLLELKNENYIKDGKTVDDDEIEEIAKYRHDTELSDIKKELYPNLSGYSYSGERYDNEHSNGEYYTTVPAENYRNNEIAAARVWDEFKIRHTDLVDAIKKEIIDNDLVRFKDSLKMLQRAENFEYYADTGEGVYTNSKKTFEELSKSSEYKYNPKEFSQYGIEYARMYKLKDYNNIVIVYSEQKMKALEDEYKAEKEEFIKYCLNIIISAIVLLLSFIYLIYSAGRTKENPEELRTFHIDRLLSIFSVALLIISGIAVFSSIFLWYESIYKKSFFILALLSILLFVLMSQSIARKIKSRKFIKDTIIYKISGKIIRMIKKLYSVETPFRKTFVIILLLGILTMIPFAGIVTIPLALYFAYREVKKYSELKKGIKRISRGEFDEKIIINGMGEFPELANDVNMISEGLSTEVERRTKSERMKTELIVNVSHDIRTPLTSVITYVDLLKKEETDNENISKYVDVIDTKSQRLKTLVDDLFEAAKAASGNINVSVEELDLNALISQGLGEIDDKISASGLDFKVSLPEQKVIVNADGKLLWRAVENLISNALKYSLEKSRVYLTVTNLGTKARIEIKNISRDEISIPKDELQERFIRGDSSRNSEGSGLGLDIARSLMLCQNGSLDISVDGDLFKATLYIPTVEKF